MLFHGSNVCVKNPRLDCNSRDTDFGDGFYLTTRIDAAQLWAERKARTSGSPHISYFALSIDSSHELNARYFNDPDDEWARFIVDCRLGKKHRYDMVVGPIADNKIAPLIWDYHDEIISYDDMISLIEPLRICGTIVYQYDLCTARALNSLRYLRCADVHG